MRQSPKRRELLKSTVKSAAVGSAILGMSSTAVASCSCPKGNCPDGLLGDKITITEHNDVKTKYEITVLDGGLYKCWDSTESNDEVVVDGSESTLTGYVNGGSDDVLVSGSGINAIRVDDTGSGGGGAVSFELAFCSDHCAYPNYDRADISLSHDGSFATSSYYDFSVTSGLTPYSDSLESGDGEYWGSSAEGYITENDNKDVYSGEGRIMSVWIEPNNAHVYMGRDSVINCNDGC